MHEDPWFTASLQASRTSIEAIRHCIGDRGLIRDVSVNDGDPGEPRVFHAECRFNTDKEDDALTGDIGVVTGAGTTPQLAVSCALGEALERYCYAVHDSAEVIVGAYDDLVARSLHAVSPDQFAIYSPSQFAASGFPFRPFTHDLAVSWTCGCSLTTGDQMWVPDRFVRAPARGGPPGDCLVGPSTTTGLCCGPSLEAAILGGICEAVERDTAMCVWANQLACARVYPKEASWIGSLLAAHFSGCGLDLRLYELSSDVAIPTVMAVLIDEMSSDAAAAVGTATKPRFEAAALKAALEAAQVRRWLKRTAAHRARKQYRSDYADIRELADHVALFGARENLQHLDFLEQRPGAERWTEAEDNADPKSDLRQVACALAQRGLDVIVVDITRPEVSALGFHVVRVLVPGLIDISADHAHRPLGARRLFAVPRLVGCRSDDSSEGELNVVPHPFP